MIRYEGASVQNAADSVIMGKLKSIKGRGGCIAIDKSGHIAMPFTTTGMFRGSIDAKGVKQILLYSTETSSVNP
jgi:beta-aspartyl-peptidase (threonine type)